MILDLSARNVPINEGLRDFIERRVRFALSRFATRIARTRVSVSDLNGPRGGIDKRCTIEVSLVGTGVLTADVADEMVEPAVSRASERIARRVREELHRRWAMKRRGRGKIREPHEE